MSIILELQEMINTDPRPIKRLRLSPDSAERLVALAPWHGITPIVHDWATGEFSGIPFVVDPHLNVGMIVKEYDAIDRT